MNGGWGISYEIALIWMPLDLTDEKSTLVQVMAWCRQSTSHYLSQCWPKSMSPNSATRPQWVKLILLAKRKPFHSGLTALNLNTGIFTLLFRMWPSTVYHEKLLWPGYQSFSNAGHLSDFLGDIFGNVPRWVNISHPGAHKLQYNTWSKGYSVFDQFLPLAFISVLQNC